MKKNIFENLFIYEMANNHMGDVQHGLKIIKEIHQVSKEHNFQFAFKFQYRQLDTFIHPAYKDRTDIKYVKRFSETRLTEEDFLKMKEELAKRNFISICTPFDEPSVDLIIKHNFEIIKIASCSFTDWPLLERITQADKPVIASTAGATLEEIDKVVMFFEHRNKQLCLMHCVGAYPTPAENLELNQLDLFKQRYKNIPIGFSTHEDPDNEDAVKMAIAKGAKVFERHVGLATEQYPINAYSSSPKQVKKWLLAADQAYKICGVKDKRREFTNKELSDLRGLKRGVFINSKQEKNTVLNESNVFFAIPNKENQLIANDFSKYCEYETLTPLSANCPIMNSDLKQTNLRKQILQIINDIKNIILSGGIKIKDKLELELSHHFGIDNFYQHGCAIINCINREYCKKIIILLPGQENPTHFHKQKEETFNIIYGDLKITLHDQAKVYEAGDLVTVEREVPHSFSSEKGAIFEEVSTTHFKNDSFYNDQSIMNASNRKTTMTFWADWLQKEIT